MIYLLFIGLVTTILGMIFKSRFFYGTALLCLWIIVFLTAHTHLTYITTPHPQGMNI